MRRLILSSLALLTATSCSPGGFLYYKEPTLAKQFECQCPETYKPSLDGSDCVREETTEPLRPPNPVAIEAGDEDDSYFSEESYFFETNGNTDWPFNINTYGVDPAIDSKGIAVPYRKLPPATPAFWRDHVLGPSRITISGPDYGIWYTKSFCLKGDQVRRYVMLVGGDNNWKMKLDGKPFASCSSSYCFKSGTFMEQTLPSGNSIVELQYLNQGGPGTVWFEFFKNNLSEVQNAQSEYDLNLVFSTKQLIGQNWDFTAEVCPPGYAYDVCSPPPALCRKTERLMGCLPPQ